jgi:hypothetical protein
MNAAMFEAIDELFVVCEETDVYPRIVGRDGDGQVVRALLVTDDPEVIEQLLELGLLSED